MADSENAIANASRTRNSSTSAEVSPCDTPGAQQPRPIARRDGVAKDAEHGSGSGPASSTSKRPGSWPDAARRARALLKGAGNALGIIVMVLPAATCWLESHCLRRREVFLFWAQAVALAPGLPGKYLRKGFYFMTLCKCSLNCDLGFMSYFTDRRAEVGDRVYVGFGVSMGMVRLGDGCLIGSRASLLNGGDQHRLGADARLTPFEPDCATFVQVGPETWIGEGVILMADVGSCCIVAAGSVVSSPIPDGCLVGGNPARFVRKLI